MTLQLEDSGKQEILRCSLGHTYAIPFVEIDGDQSVPTLGVIVKDLISQDLQQQSDQASERLFEFSDHIIHALMVPNSSPYSTSNLHLLIIKQSLEREVQHGVY